MKMMSFSGYGLTGDPLAFESIALISLGYTGHSEKFQAEKILSYPLHKQIYKQKMK